MLVIYEVFDMLVFSIGLNCLDCYCFCFCLVWMFTWWKMFLGGNGYCCCYIGGLC